jgi:hypothetical protein
VPFQHLDHAGFLPEPLHHPNPGDRLLDMLGDVGGALLRGPGRGIQPGPYPVHHQRDHQQRSR